MVSSSTEQGDADAQKSLGYMYYKGKGVLQDYNQAVRWYRKAAEQGHAAGLVALGVMYAGGEGVSKDFILAHMLANLAVQ